MELPQYRIVKHEPDEYGRKYIDIFITDGDKDLAIMTVYLEQTPRKNFKPLDKINISYVEKYDESLKRCFREYMKILVSKTAEIFGRKLSKSSEITLFIAPQPNLKIDFNESFSVKELKKIYNKSGFANYDPNNSLFMVVTMKTAEEVLNGKNIKNDPYKTPSNSIDYGSPEKPEKEENKDPFIAPPEPIPLIYKKDVPRYMRQTTSSRGKRVIKRRGGKTRRKRQ